MLGRDRSSLFFGRRFGAGFQLGTGFGKGAGQGRQVVECTKLILQVRPQRGAVGSVQVTRRGAESLDLGSPGVGAGDDVLALLLRRGDGRRCLILAGCDEPGCLGLRFGNRLVGGTLGGKQGPLQHPFRALDLVEFGLDLLHAGTGLLPTFEEGLEGSRDLIEEDVDLLVVVATEGVVEALPLDILRRQAHQSPPPQTALWTKKTMRNHTRNARSIGKPIGWGMTLRRALTGGSVSA